MGEEDQLPETLKPFFHRATEAQERLARLEAALASSTKTDVPDAELVEKINQIQSKLGEANETVKQEKDKVEKLTSENEKQRYRILHLLRALKDADEKLEKLSK
ncbi:Threonine-tRNA ligase 2 [Hirschfeldia incana]|nr:Threonine-tRNA ligase 2 [Hirschfeldia incana]